MADNSIEITYISYEGTGGEVLTPTDYFNKYLWPYLKKDKTPTLGKNYKKVVNKATILGLPPQFKPGNIKVAPKALKNLLINTLDEVGTDQTILNRAITGPRCELGLVFEVPFSTTIARWFIDEYKAMKMNNETGIELAKNIEKQMLRVTLPNYPMLHVTDSESNYIHYTYQPTYTLGGYDRGFMEKLYNGLHKKDKQKGYVGAEAIVVYNKLVKIASKYFFGTGSPQGQMGRLKKCLELRNKVAAQRTFSWLQNRKRIFAFWDKNMNVQDTSGIQLTDNFLLNWDLYPLLIPTTPGAGAGIVWSTPEGFRPYPILKHKDVFQAELWATTQLFSLWKMEFLKDRETTFAKLLAAKYAWARIVLNKPKEEVYSQEEYLTKTRNIFPTNTFVHYPFGAVLRAVIGGFDIKSRFLHGFSPFKGGVTTLISSMWQEVVDRGVSGETPFVWKVFADNVFFLWETGGEYFWASLDGSKMEASIHREPVELFTEWLSSKIVLPKFYKAFLEKAVPTLTVSNIGIYGTAFFDIPFLSSGATGTSYLNGIMMAQVLIEAESNKMKEPLIMSKDGWVFSPQLEKAMEQVGVVLTIESVVNLSTVTFGEEIDLDLLGFNGVFYKVESTEEDQKWIIIPVLKEERLLKSVLFHKKFSKASAISGVDKSDETEELKDTADMYIVVKTWVLFALGAWRLDGVRTELWTRAKDKLKNLADRVGELMSMKEEVNEQFEAFLDQLIDGLELLDLNKEFSGIIAVPSVEKLTELLAPPDYKELVFKVISETIGLNPDDLTFSNWMMLYSRETFEKLYPNKYEEFLAGLLKSGRITNWADITEIEEGEIPDSLHISALLGDLNLSLITPNERNQKLWSDISKLLTSLPKIETPPANSGKLKDVIIPKLKVGESLTTEVADYGLTDKEISEQELFGGTLKFIRESIERYVKLLGVRVYFYGQGFDTRSEVMRIKTFAVYLTRIAAAYKLPHNMRTMVAASEILANRTVILSRKNPTSILNDKVITYRGRPVYAPTRDIMFIDAATKYSKSRGALWTAYCLEAEEDATKPLWINSLLYSNQYSSGIFKEAEVFSLSSEKGGKLGEKVDKTVIDAVGPVVYSVENQVDYFSFINQLNEELIEGKYETSGEELKVVVEPIKVEEPVPVVATTTIVEKQNKGRKSSPVVTEAPKKKKEKPELVLGDDDEPIKLRTKKGGRKPGKVNDS